MVPRTAPGPPPFANPPSNPPSKRRRWPWVAAALVLLAAAAGGGYAFLTRDDDNGSSDVATDRRTTDDDSSAAEPTDSGAESTEPADESDDASTDTDPSESGVEAPSTTATASEPVPPGATCWDGSTATSVDLCSRPQGLAGLTYVFPSMAGQGCTSLSGSAPGRKLLVQCTGHLQDGTAIKINYSQWASVSAATEHYEGKGLTQTLAANGISTFSGYANTGELNNAWIYQKEPYSASVYALDQAAMSQALSTLVIGVPPTEVRGSAG
jgi:hypothetical protein